MVLNPQLSINDLAPSESASGWSNRKQMAKLVIAIVVFDGGMRLGKKDKIGPFISSLNADLI
jgi:hypothetical protein